MSRTKGDTVCIDGIEFEIVGSRSAIRKVASFINVLRSSGDITIVKIKVQPKSREAYESGALFDAFCTHSSEEED